VLRISEQVFLKQCCESPETTADLETERVIFRIRSGLKHKRRTLQRAHCNKQNQLKKPAFISENPKLKNALDCFCEAIFFSKTARCAQTLPAFVFFEKKIGASHFGLPRQVFKTVNCLKTKQLRSNAREQFTCAPIFPFPL
jgi:hypothetical protein